MRIQTVLTATLALASALQAGCSPAPAGESGPGILVIAIDGLRFDHLGIGGYDRPTSPALDALAAEGVFFREAYAAAPWQVPAHMALLSAADPRLARRILPAEVLVSQATLWHLPDEAPHPAADFLSQGFATAMFYDHPNLAPVYGYQRGFELYQGPSRQAEPGRPSNGSEAVFRRFDQWLTRTPHGKSWFAYLEVADLERVWTEVDPRWDTYFPPRPELAQVPPVGDAQHIFFALARSRWSGGMSTLGEYEARYDGAIAQLDAAFKRLRAHMEQLGRFENTTIVVVGAYGMSFGESGLLLDSGTYADTDLHVPLIVRPARSIQVRAGSTSDELVSTMDVLPTLLAISGLPPAGRADGVSFAHALTGEAGQSRKYVQASCGLQEGFATLDSQHCFERTFPGRTQDPRLRASWFGDSEPHDKVVRDVIHDRKREPALGHIHSPVADSPIALNLAKVGEAWAQKIEVKRARWQGLAPSSGPGAPPLADDR